MGHEGAKVQSLFDRVNCVSRLLSHCVAGTEDLAKNAMCFFINGLQLFAKSSSPAEQARRWSSGK